MKSKLAVCWIAAAALPLLAPPSNTLAPAPTFDAAFWKQWGDGQAELSGYDLVFPRYGQLRRASP